MSAQAEDARARRRDQARARRGGGSMQEYRQRQRAGGVTRARARDYRNATDRWKAGGMVGPRPRTMREADTLPGEPLAAVLDRMRHDIVARLHQQAAWRDPSTANRALPRGWSLVLDARARGRAEEAHARGVVASYLAEVLGLWDRTSDALKELNRWRRGGRLSVYTADRVCSAIGRHISEVYGPAWEDAT